jgi:ribosomal protein S28E/S33
VDVVGSEVIGVFDCDDDKEDEVTEVGLGLAEVLEGVVEVKKELLDGDDDGTGRLVVDAVEGAWEVGDDAVTPDSVLVLFDDIVN